MDRICAHTILPKLWLLRKTQIASKWGWMGSLTSILNFIEWGESRQSEGDWCNSRKVIEVRLLWPYNHNVPLPMLPKHPRDVLIWGYPRLSMKCRILCKIWYFFITLCSYAMIFMSTYNFSQTNNTPLISRNHTGNVRFHTGISLRYPWHHTW